MTTAPAPVHLGPSDVADALEELLRLAVEVAVAESRLEEAAKDAKWTMGGEALIDVVPSTYSGAARAEITDALLDACGKGKHESCLTSLEVCQSIQDAIDVLKFAIERSDDAS